jgi:soluble lytic murein transglycosylase-like protein
MADVNHVVSEGESLWLIARKYATTPQAIARANRIPSPYLIEIGRNLRIPVVAPVPPPATAPASPGNAITPPPAVTHAVVRGESLTLIAARYNVALDALSALNGITNPNRIRIGQVLQIPVAAPPSVESLLLRYSKNFQVDPALVKALAWQESGWQQQVVSSLGAVGVMQLMPETGRFTQENLLQHVVDPANVEHNVEAGVAFLAYLLDRTGGNQALAIAGYYQGLRSVQARGMLPDTKRYVANVMALRQRFAP